MTENNATLMPSKADRTASPQVDMIWIAGATFRMGSDSHYPEEAPVHRVTVDGFFMDAKPVTNRDFRKFVNASRRSRFHARCSKAARTCVRPVTAAGIGRPHGMRSRLTHRPAMSAFDVL
jgi:formylglycine-generating enzyme required for sulfatase activity